MNKTMNIVVVMAGLLMTGASAARAQAPTPPSQGDMFLNVSVGSGGQSRTFTNSTTFQNFNETATVDGNQTVGRGFVVDLTGGYRYTNRIAFALGFWTAHAKGGAAATAAIPDPLFFGRFTTVSLTASDLKQSNVGVDLQFIYTIPIADRIDVALFAGPTMIYVRQEIGSINVAPGTQNASFAVVEESKTTGKAGIAGVDVSYRLTEKYAGGLFVRYAGGEVDLPSAPKLKVGGIQVGVGVRLRF